MNLFCFSLEGSMDSLYEAVQESADGQVYTIPSRSCSRSCSPAVLLDDNTKWHGPGRSISMEISQMQSTTSKMKKRRTHVSKSASDNETLDRASCDASLRRAAKGREELGPIRNNPSEDLEKPNHRVDTQTKGGKARKPSNLKNKDKPAPPQPGSHDGWAPTADCPDNRQMELIVHADAEGSKQKPTVKKGQKHAKKACGKSGKEGAKKSHDSKAHRQPRPISPEMGPFLDEDFRADRRLYLGKASTLPAQENTTPGRAMDMRHLPGGATPIHQQRWSNPAKSGPGWGASQHICRRPLTEYRAYTHDFTLPQEKDWDDQHQGVAQDGSLKREASPQVVPGRVARSVTEADLSNPNRSTSFGKFEGLRNQPSPAKLEENGTITVTEDYEGESSDPSKSAGLGKKMKAISLTMRRRMGKKHVKSLSEEIGDDTERNQEGGTESSPPVEIDPAKTSNSLESLYSGQSSSSGVTSVSEGSSQRSSLRLEEDGSYNGQFCGRARVHTDFVPSPYDTDSLKLKTGDIINIISKPPMGIWTGMLNNKVGNFKFIYVDVVVEKEKEEEVPKIRQQKLCRRPRPKTLLELLERLHLEEYASALLLNGYQTVEDLMHLQEKHLIELNMTNPEHRSKLLAVADYHYTESDDLKVSVENKSSQSQQEEKSDCPRDSGCFIPSECSDNSKDEAENVHNPQAENS